MSVSIDRRPAGKYDIQIPTDDYVLLGKIAKRLGRHANPSALYTQFVERYISKFEDMVASGELSPECETGIPGPYTNFSVRIPNEVKKAIDTLGTKLGWDFQKVAMFLGHLGIRDIMTGDGPLAGKAF
ncbi:MAG: putative DNA-binding protein [Kiritimatiellia bacterium]|jgi:predicted DNA-binding protein